MVFLPLQSTGWGGFFVHMLLDMHRELLFFHAFFPISLFMGKTKRCGYGILILISV